MVEVLGLGHVGWPTVSGRYRDGVSTGRVGSDALKRACAVDFFPRLLTAAASSAPPSGNDIALPAQITSADHPANAQAANSLVAQGVLSGN
jgi:hypothetical protein